MAEAARGTLIVCPGLAALSRRAADLFAARAQAALAARGRFLVALAGGTTPRRLYAQLAARRPAIPWADCQLFFGDERCVPPAHPDSNYRLVKETLLDRAPIPSANVHRMPAEDEDRERAAAAYEETLRRVFGLGGGERPRFDLVLLGLGADGHTASLFPGTAALGERHRLVVATAGGGADRLTMTVPVLNAAACVAFLIAGAAKARALAAVLEGEEEPERWPAQLLRPERGDLVYLADRSAAAALGAAAGSRLSRDRSARDGG